MAIYLTNKLFIGRKFRSNLFVKLKLILCYVVQFSKQDLFI